VYVLSLTYGDMSLACGDMTPNSKELCAHSMFNSSDLITLLVFCKLWWAYYCMEDLESITSATRDEAKWNVLRV